MITKKRFASLTPWQRGYMVYMCGERDDQPNVPNESNPYRPGTHKARRWDAGQQAALLAVIDGEE